MTLFHVLKYPPAEITRRYLLTNDDWDDFLPRGLAMVLKHHLYHGQHRFAVEDYPTHVEKVFTEYDGPLE